MSDQEVNPYELLDVPTEATEQEIRRAYRQRSLKVHPDRNPNNPDAARKFHELNQAYELLLDPLRRLAVDAKLRLKQAKAERFKGYDNKRKILVAELEERERAFKKVRVDKQKEEVARWHETEKIKDEGRRLREEKEKEMQKRDSERFKAAEQSLDELEEPTLDSNDTTVRVKYTLSEHPNLTTSEALSTLFAPFGPTDNIVVLLKPPKKFPNKPPKYGTALLPFKRIGDAFAAVCASGRPERGLKGIDVTWVGGKEPKILEWLRKMGQLGAVATPTADTGLGTRSGATPQTQNSSSSSSAFSSFPDSFPELPTPSREAPVAPAVVDYESLTLMRLRQAERERLEREIREQEENE